MSFESNIIYVQVTPISFLKFMEHMGTFLSIKTKVRPCGFTAFFTSKHKGWCCLLHCGIYPIESMLYLHIFTYIMVDVYCKCMVYIYIDPVSMWTFQCLYRIILCIQRTLSFFPQNVVVDLTAEKRRRRWGWTPRGKRENLVFGGTTISRPSTGDLGWEHPSLPDTVTYLANG